jgi:Uri superfamily endonuclease
MNTTAFIYGIRNVVDNKLYIGSTKSFKRRKYEHFNLLRRNKHANQYLQRSFNKYGEDSFHMFLIEECEISLRLSREIYHIDVNKCSDPEIGFNLHAPNEDKFSCSAETKDKMRKSLIKSGYAVSVDAYTIDLIFIESFDSVSMCSKALNIPDYVIHSILNGKNNRLSFKGLTFFKKGETPVSRKSPKQRDMSNFRKC